MKRMKIVNGGFVGCINFFICLVIAFCSSLSCAYALSASDADESFDDKIATVVDGPMSAELHLPIREWYPKKTRPEAVVLALHGLTLHGGLYEIMGKVFATDGYYFCAPDMRGFGRCFFSDHKYCVGTDCKKKINHEKSYADIVALANRIKEKYPNIPMFVMGESLGTSFAIRLAAEHPDLVSGLILSGPTVEVNPLMFFHPKIIAAGSVGYFMTPRFQVNMDAFVKYLVSNDENTVKDLIHDPLCRKGLTISELLATRRYVKRTLAYARGIKTEEPILVVQGSADKCMVPEAVTKLARNINSSDQTLRWLHNHGHLLFETAYIRPATIDSLDSWLDQHEGGKFTFKESTVKALHRFAERDDDDEDQSGKQDRPD